jgi:hypothetical protein
MNAAADFSGARVRLQYDFFVIPAKAGIYLDLFLDSRFRGNDEAEFELR